MLFRQLLGAGFDSLPARLREVHGNSTGVWRGLCDVERGSNPLAVAAALATRLPPSGRCVPLTVTIARDSSEARSREQWLRNFDGHRMNSTLWREGEFLLERLGWVTFKFRLRVVDAGIDWQIAGARILGIPAPLVWFRGASARELTIDGRYTFDVRATLPLVGLLIRYHGWLQRDE